MYLHNAQSHKCTLFVESQKAQFLNLFYLHYTLITLLKPGLHESQLPVGRNVPLVSSIVVERRRCALQVSSVL